MQLQQKQVNPNKQRLECVICDYRIDPKDESAFSTFPCNVRAFMGEKFKVWRCPDCKTIHCLDVVDLDHYYAKYPLAQAKLTQGYRILCSNVCRQLIKHGFSKTHSLLDYGCGGNGLFVQYFRERGFSNTYGYDPYASEDSFGDPAVLGHGLFDYILLHEVIEHVEDPNILLSKLNSLLSPSGYILIATPNAANINLNRSDLADHYNPVHVPYHIHIYTHEILESLGTSQGWEPVDFIERRFGDTRWFGFNVRAWNAYVRLFDGSLDILLEPLQIAKALSSYQLLFYAIFGYWLSFRCGMGIMFRKCV
ncbi:methyltransferase domain-containing protein [Nostoc sp. DSM 114167]|jgi:SAM-dependent methyltransferase|uniref:methyltransferase domain-containing protein n=1 Tax=Nostoc sp. DSM 114167 TaxID=3439050 RepID=UPI0040452B25